jgi:Uncharacterized conserved protein, contains double-stranded beta-helix domain
MKTGFFAVVLAIPVLLVGLLYQNVHAEELKVLESQLNKDSITGILQNPYNYTVGYMLPRAEFYDKEDGHLVGLRDFGFVSKDELKPGEKSTYKIWEHAGDTEDFPKTGFIIKVDAQKVHDTDHNEGKVLSFDEQISKINNYTNALNAATKATLGVAQQNGTKGIANYTVTYENGTKELVNKTGTYKITTEP